MLTISQTWILLIAVVAISAVIGRILSAMMERRKDIKNLNSRERAIFLAGRRVK